MQFLSDCWSRVMFEFAKFRWGQTHLRQYFLWALAPVLALLLYQIIFRSRRRRQQPGARERRARPSSGRDWTRSSIKSKGGWRSGARDASRASRFPPGCGAPAPTRRWPTCRSRLQELLRLHYRYRFDPQGLSRNDREALRREAGGCLARMD